MPKSSHSRLGDKFADRWREFSLTSLGKRAGLNAGSANGRIHPVSDNRDPLSLARERKLFSGLLSDTLLSWPRLSFRNQLGLAPAYVQPSSLPVSLRRTPRRVPLELFFHSVNFSQNAAANLRLLQC